MNLEQCRLAARNIDTELAEICAQVQQETISGLEGKTTRHLRWMCHQIQTMSYGKAMRWLGYVQGVLVASYGQPLENMKEISKEVSGEEVGLDMLDLLTRARAFVENVPLAPRGMTDEALLALCDALEQAEKDFT